MNSPSPSRRHFLAATAGVMLAPALPALLKGDEMPDDVRITRIVAFDLRSRRNKVAGKNARLDVHGDSAVDPMVRIYTNVNGLEGIGVCRAKQENVAQLLGQNPAKLFDASKRRMTGPLGSQTMPLWDLIGRMQKKPVYELIRGEGKRHANGQVKVAVYDGSIYFADLLPQYESAWEDEFRREIDLGRELGHRAFKIKIGRGSKWMPRDEGDARDVAVVRTIRAHAGEDAILGVDANNGYDLDGAKRFMEQVGELKIAFTEEMFPEVVEQCLELKRFYCEKGWETLLADGETQHELEVFKPFIAAKAIDVLQGDMNHFGIEGILTEAEWARPQDIQVAPHNWGSLMGFYQQLHVGAAIDNFYRAEHDPLTNDVLFADGYAIADGVATVSDAPGFGLRVNDDRFASEVKVRYELKA